MKVSATSPKYSSVLPTLNFTLFVKVPPSPANVMDTIASGLSAFKASMFTQR